MSRVEGDGIVVIDGEGRLTTVSDALAALVGRSRDDLQGKPVTAVLSDGAAARFHTLLQNLGDASGPESVTGKFDVHTASGDVRTCQIHLSSIPPDGDDERAAVGVFREGGDRAERLLTFQALYEATHELVAATDRESIIQVLADTARDVLGLTLVAVWTYDRDAEQLVPAVFPDELAAVVDPPTYEAGGSLSWDVFVDGETRVFHDLREIEGVYNPETEIRSEIIAPIRDHGILNSGATEPGAFDETDRYLVDILVETAAEALDRVEREAMLAQLSIGVKGLMEADTMEEVAELGTASAEEILGHSRTVVRLLSEDGQRLEPVVVSEPVIEEVGARPAYRIGEGTAGKAYERGEIVAYDSDELDDDVERGAARSILCVPLGEYGVMTIADVDDEGFDDAAVQFAGILASNVETALGRIERQRELERQNERLDEFASVISHDLRNPLNIALTQLELLEEEEEEVDTTGTDRIRRALERMQTLIEDVLSLARNGSDVVDPEPVPLGPVARRAWATAGSPDGDLRVEGTLGSVEGDRGRLQQLLENLFRNAREHVGESVTVRIGRTESGFFVEDDGAGVPEDVRERVFESGYTTTGQGTGFGLAIVERIAEAHAWSIEVVDGKDGGARFEISGVETA